MVTCVVANCKNTSGKISKNKDGITFHRFPRNQSRRKQWEQAVNREIDWAPTDFSVVCSDHFVANDFYLTESGLRRLFGAAVPSINISPCQDSEPTISKLPLIEIELTDTEQVIELKYKVRRLEALADNRKRRLLLMWKSNMRMKKKLARMREILRHLTRYKGAKEALML